MSVMLQQLYEQYHYVIVDLSDHRTKSWWLMDGPGPLFCILASYLFFCSYAGPQYMKERKPFNLKKVIMVYNLLQIALSIFLVYRCLEFVTQTTYSFNCYAVDYSDNPEAVRYAGGVWWYFFAKITELLDTVFFVLRKKNCQVSFLHLYHHTMMPMLAWFGTKYTAGGQAIPEGGINAFIHVVMYTYYFLAGLGPEYQKYLWWKKYITILQLVQFSIVMYLNIVSIMDTQCGYPKWLSAFVIANCLAFLYMFGRFYYNSYVNKRKPRIDNGDKVNGIKKDS